MWVRLLTLADCDNLDATFGKVGGDIDPRAELSQPLTQGWVAHELPAELLGFALGWWVVDELQLIWIGTRTEHRRRGVGRALLDQVVADVRGLGGRRVLLEVSRDNVAAIALYERNGFSVMRVRPAYYRKTGQDALEMELVL